MIMTTLEEEKFKNQRIEWADEWTNEGCDDLVHEMLEKANIVKLSIEMTLLPLIFVPH